MFKGENGGSVETVRGVVRVVLILAVVFVLAGVFNGGLSSVNGVSIPGAALMALGIIAVIAAEPLARRLCGERADRASLVVKLAGVLVCAVGAILIICV